MNRLDGFVGKTKGCPDFLRVVPALLGGDEKHLGIAYHGTADVRRFENVILLDDRQNVAAKFAHLPVIFLDHADPSRNFERSRGLFEDSNLRHRSGHRDNLLPAIICHQEVGRSPHLRCVLGNLTQLKMRDSAVYPDVADTVKESPLFAIPAPGAKQLAHSIALFSFPGSATRVEQELLY